VTAIWVVLIIVPTHRSMIYLLISLSSFLLQGKKLAVCSAATKSLAILCLENFIWFISPFSYTFSLLGVRFFLLIGVHPSYFFCCRSIFKALIASLLVYSFTPYCLYNIETYVSCLRILDQNLFHVVMPPIETEASKLKVNT
jgi:hypothetical protein